MTVYVLFGRGDDYYDGDEVWDVFLTEANAIAEATRLTELGTRMKGLSPMEQVAFGQEHQIPPTTDRYNFSVQPWETKP